MDIHKTYIWSDGPETECVVSGLQTTHIYQFRVYAQNEAGRGEALLNKKVIRVKAATKKPPFPSKPHAEVEDDESVLLKWTVPSGYSELNYIVERYEPKLDLWVQCNHGILARTSYLITGLLPGKEYKFRVSCENTHGVGLPSEESDPVIIKETEEYPPTITVPVTDCFVKAEDTAVFSCEYKGTPPILVNWSKDGIRVRESFGALIKTESYKSTLHLEEVESDDDECSVQCDLRNSEGKASSRAKIKIFSSPKINCPCSYKDGLTYDEGDNLRLKPTFTGKPVPSINWFFNDKEPILDDRMEVSFGTEFIEVRISGLRHTDTGIYKFVAKNEVGKDVFDVHVIVTGPPSPPPGHPYMKLRKENIAELMWNIPVQDGGSSVYNYIIEIRKLDSLEWERFGTSRDACLQITDVIGLDKCAFRIKAENIYGLSEPSQEYKLNVSVLNDGETSEFFEKVIAGTMIDVSGNNVEVEKTDTLVELDTNEEYKTHELRHVPSITNTGDLMEPTSRMPLKQSVEKEFDTICLQFAETDKNRVLEESAIGEEDIDNKSTESMTELEADIRFALEEETDKMKVVHTKENETTIPVVSATMKEIVQELSKLEDFVTDLPMKIMFVATQTLIPSPILNFACLDESDFDEITHFAAEVAPQEEYLIQIIDNILCYTVCCMTVPVEHALLENFVGTNSVFKGNCSWLFEDSFLQNYIPSCYDCNSDEYTMKLSAKSMVFTEHFMDIVCITEQVYIDFPSFKVLCFPLLQQAEEIRSKCTEAALECMYTWVLESLKPVIINFPIPQNPSVNLELRDSIIIFETVTYNGLNTLEVPYESLTRPMSITHIPGEFETLVGLKCVPMTLYKPALSVLPMSRTTLTEVEERRNDRERRYVIADEADCNRRFNDIFSHFSDSNDLIKVDTSLDICSKCSSKTICLCSLVDDGSRKFYSLESNAVQVNSMQNSSDNGFYKAVEEKQTYNDISNNLPEWLRFVSPCTFALNESNTDTNIDFESENLFRENIAENEQGKIYKDKSVQELLNLAEEVEKNFTQKTEHIESLESILQEELNSLEKGLQTVHEIHQTFWNDSSLEWGISDSLDETKVYEMNTVIERDLIDFKKDVPLEESKEVKQDEYAPEVITHLQNRVVQCGCRTRLYCSFSGKPDPQIAWLKNGRLLSQSSRYVCGNLVEFGLYVDIFNAKSSDSGEYMCIATNCHGSAQTQAYLRVVGQREYSPEEPRFLISPSDVSVTQGESVTLEWKIMGTPVPHVVWFKNAERIETSLRIDTLSNHRGCCRLVLHDVMVEDSAIYTCYLENEAGSSVSTVLVSVTDGNQSCCEDSFQTDFISNILCLTDDTYIPSLEYYERLVQDATSSVEKQFRKASRGHKCCKDLPGPPFNPRILNSGQTWAVLSWSVPTKSVGRTNDLIYLLEQRYLNSENWTEAGRTRNTLFTVYGLKSGQSYVFRISAGNKDGWGPSAILTQPVHCGTDQID